MWNQLPGPGALLTSSPEDASPEYLLERNGARRTACQMDGRGIGRIAFVRSGKGFHRPAAVGTAMRLVGNDRDAGSLQPASRRFREGSSLGQVFPPDLQRMGRI